MQMTLRDVRAIRQPLQEPCRVPQAIVQIPALALAGNVSKPLTSQSLCFFDAHQKCDMLSKYEVCIHARHCAWLYCQITLNPEGLKIISYSSHQKLVSNFLIFYLSQPSQLTSQLTLLYSNRFLEKILLYPFYR